MANEVELEALIVPIRADVQQLTMAFRQAEERTRQTVARIDAEMAKLQTSMKNVGSDGAPGARQAAMDYDRIGQSVGRSTMQLYSFMRIGHLAMRIPSLQNAQQGLQLVGHGAMYAGMAISRMTKSWHGMAAGIAAGILITTMQKLQEYLNRNEIAARKMFGEMLKGAKSFQEALDDLKIERLTQGVNDAVDAGFAVQLLASTLKSSAMPQVGVAVEAAGQGMYIMEKAIADAQAQQDILKQIVESEQGRRYLAGINSDIARRDIDKENVKLEQTVQRLNMGADASKQYAEAQKLAHAGNISISQALAQVNDKLERQRQLQQVIAAQSTLDQARKIGEQVQRTGMGTNEAKLFEEAQRRAGLERGTAGARTAAQIMAGPEIALMRQALASLDIGKVWEDTTKLAISLDKQNREFSAGANAAERYGHVLEYARNNNVSEEEAERRLAGVMIQRRIIQEQLSRKPAQDKARQLEQEADRMNLGADAAMRLQLIQEKVNKDRREGESYASAYARAEAQIAGELNRISAAQARLSEKPLWDKVRELGMEAGRIGMLADEAERFKIAQEYAYANSISVAEALQRLNTGLETMRGIQDRLAGAKLFEEVLSPTERYALKVQELDRLLANGAITQGTWNLQIIKANNEILKLNQALNPVQATKWPSAEALSRLDAYRDRLAAMRPIVNRDIVQSTLADLRNAPERQPLQAPPPLPVTAPEGVAPGGYTKRTEIGTKGAPAPALPSGDTAQSWALTIGSSAQNWATQVINSGTSFDQVVNSAGRNFFTQIDAAARYLQAVLTAPQAGAAPGGSWLTKLTSTVQEGVSNAGQQQSGAPAGMAGGGLSAAAPPARPVPQYIQMNPQTLQIEPAAPPAPPAPQYVQMNPQTLQIEPAAPPVPGGGPPGGGTNLENLNIADGLRRLIELIRFQQQANNQQAGNLPVVQIQGANL